MNLQSPNYISLFSTKYIKRKKQNIDDFKTFYWRLFRNIFKFRPTKKHILSPKSFFDVRNS